jgi:predicted DNA-binding protein
VSKNQQVNIRFDDETDTELETTAEALGVSKSALVRRLTRQFLDDVRKRGALSLGAEWVRDLARADGRSAWGESKIEAASAAEEPGPRPVQRQSQSKDSLNYLTPKKPKREKP